MKKILVPCDFSDKAYEAFKFAVKIASKTSGEVTVFHTVYIPAYDPIYLSGIETDIRKAFEKMESSLASYPAKTSLEIAHGEIVPSAKHLIEKLKTDLVVMGTSGTSGMAELFIGSNTEKIVRHSPVPVLAVRKAPELSAVKNILLPSTLNLDQVEFINKVKELQEFFNATLHVLLINTPIRFRSNHDAGEALEEFTHHYKLQDFKTYFRNYRNEEEGIINFANTEKMDLVAMATHAYKGLAHIFNISITEHVVNHIQSPIWTYALKTK